MIIWDALCDLILFVPTKQRVKQPLQIDTFRKVLGRRLQLYLK